MVTLNEKTNSILIGEELTFEHTVQPILDDETEYLETEYVNLDDDDYYTNNYGHYKKEVVGHCLNYIQKNLGPDDKNEILQKIIDAYERQDYYEDSSNSIFNEDMIREQVQEWIDEKLDEIAL